LLSLPQIQGIRRFFDSIAQSAAFLNGRKSGISESAGFDAQDDENAA
jgi:hypothetical protein